MNFPFFIARRYLFSKKSTHAINVISAISVIGVAERGENALDNERARLMRQYDQLKSEVQTYENNLGFLNASSKKGNSLIDEMNRKVQKLKDELQLVREKVKAIDAENASKD